MPGSEASFKKDIMKTKRFDFEFKNRTPLLYASVAIIMFLYVYKNHKKYYGTIIFDVILQVVT